jgi:two-component system chemotaxis sensor kinase CheA
MKAETVASLKGISEKIAIELVFAESGKDLGLLPLNSLLLQIEELLAGPEAPEALVTGAQQARRWVDEIFETTGTFSSLSLKRFGEWVAWWQAAVGACEGNRPVTPPPADWERASVTTTTAGTGTAKTEAPASREEPTLVLNLAEDRDLLNEFINESQEHLQNIEQGVLVLEDNPGDADTLDSIFRAFHTFKGGSGFLNLAAIQSLAHELESLLDLARQHKLELTPSVINIILEGGDTLKRFVTEIAAHLAGQKPPGPIVVPTLGLLAGIRDVLEADSSAGTSVPASAAPIIQPAPAIPASAPPPEVVLAAPAASAPKPAPDSAIVRTSESKDTARSNPVATAVKVDTLKLDGLIDLVGEMVIAQSLVVQSPDITTLHSEQLNRDLAHLSRISKDLQRTAMSLRMVPVRATFQKMNRLVRDITAKVGKEVELVTEGEDTELDRTIVEEINDPLIHMIRNSVDHGIEKPEIRRQRGKPGHGTVLLRAYHQGGNIVIEIKDDGNGLDRERILAKAIEKGLIKPDEHLPENEVFNLIMGAGFSTADKVTDLSGRGVGMDVVRRNIEKLRGKIEIESATGKGSTFRIHLPLTMAIIDGLIVEIGGHRYIIPTLSVCESFRPAPGMIHRVNGRGEMIEVRGRLRPVLRLYEHLGIQPTSTDPGDSIAVVVESGNSARCVLVDRMLGKQEVVIKSLGETFRQNRYVAGAAILGDGRVGLILDPQSLVFLEAAPLEAAA